VILYLSVEQVLRLHANQIGRFGGGRGLSDRGALEAAVARPRATFGGEDLYLDLASKAAALMHSLVMNHPFVDGNKRVGAMTAELFIEVNERSLLATNEEFEEITMAVARGEIDAESLAIWFRQRISGESYLAEYAAR
jgi:death-on-curing protein